MRSWPTVIAVTMLFMLGGCNRVKSVVSTKPTIVSESLFPAQMEILVTTGFPSSPSKIMLIESLSKSDKERRLLFQHLYDRGYFHSVGVLRNPGVRVYIVSRKVDGTPLTQDDIDSLKALAATQGATSTQILKIKQVTGPDGKTPLIMKNPTEYYSNSPKKIGDITSTLFFASKEKALEASKYFDSAYKTRVTPTDQPAKGWYMTATIRDDIEKATDETIVLEKFAKRFGGTYIYVETTN